MFREVVKGVYTPCYVHRMFARRGHYIHKNSFMKMLRNRFYVGEVFVPEYRDEKIGTIPAHYVKGQHEPLIDKDTLLMPNYAILRLYNEILRDINTEGRIVTMSQIAKIEEEIMSTRHDYQLLLTNFLMVR